jgi:hypothetical protein
VNVTQTHLTWPGQAELSNISDRQNTAIASSKQNKRIPHRNAAPAHNAPTLPATLPSRLNKQRHINYAASQVKGCSLVAMYRAFHICVSNIFTAAVTWAHKLRDITI